jgi:hypothetical protein
VSETKETEAGAEAQSEGNDAAEVPADEAVENADASDADASDAVAPKKKKKKARDESEPEAIKDRNARVRADAYRSSRCARRPRSPPRPLCRFRLRAP